MHTQAWVFTPVVVHSVFKPPFFPFSPYLKGVWRQVAEVWECVVFHKFRNFLRLADEWSGTAPPGVRT